MNDESNNKEVNRSDWLLEKGTKLLDGRFEVLSILHAEDKEFTCRCRDTVSQNNAILKTILPGQSIGPDELNWMVARFQALRSLKHPNIPECLYMMQDGDQGTWFMVTENAEGIPLFHCDRLFAADGRMDIHDTLHICSQVANVMDAAHNAGIVFGDFQRGNILVSGDGLDVAFIDFGGYDTGNNYVNISGRVTEALWFVSPEQWQGRKAVPATDQFALTVMAYCCLAGHPPFQTNDAMQLKRMVLRGNILEIYGLPENTAKVLKKGMFHYPEERYGSCAEFMDALSMALASKANSLEPLSLQSGTLETNIDVATTIDSEEDVPGETETDSETETDTKATTVLETETVENSSLSEKKPDLVKDTTAKTEDTIQSPENVPPVAQPANEEKKVDSNSLFPIVPNDLDNPTPLKEVITSDSDNQDSIHEEKSPSKWGIVLKWAVLVICAAIAAIVIDIVLLADKESQRREGARTIPIKQKNNDPMTYQGPFVIKPIDAPKSQVVDASQKAIEKNIADIKVSSNQQLQRTQEALNKTDNQLTANIPSSQEKQFINNAGHQLITITTMSLPPGSKQLELVKIKAGSFMMGSPINEIGHNTDEDQHRVNLTHDFWLGKTEVTQAQYEAIKGSNPSHYKGGSNFPVVYVSWYDAMDFCRKLTERERTRGQLPDGYEYTLPTEAQWEYACRAGTTTPWYGTRSNENIDDLGWHGTNSNLYIHPVGLKRPNAWGLYDMHGNVYEWCLDWYGNYPQSEVTEPKGPYSGINRVYRGGSKDSTKACCRSAFRHYASPHYSASDTIGFRVALVYVGKSDSTGVAPASKKIVIDSKATQDKNVGINSISSPQSTETGRLPASSMTVTLSGNVKLEMIAIKAGSFTMGSPVDEPGHHISEVPHDVILTKDFWLGKTEVTQIQWNAIMGTNLRGQAEKQYPGESNKKYAKMEDDLPMYFVNWDEAMEFCQRLTEQERKAGKLPDGYVYTLPTEAQWEYACRAGSKSALYTGSINILGKANAPALDEIAWYAGNSNVGYTGRGWDMEKYEEKQYSGKWAGPRKVGSRKPNDWGLYDMLGNVSEWCLDWSGGYSSYQRSNPIGPDTGTHRIFRGASWSSEARYCRSAARFAQLPTTRGNNIGFRVALSCVNK